MKTTHTPGVWRQNSYAAGFPGPFEGVEFVVWGGDEKSGRLLICAKVKTEADARLIAAAPDLLDACRRAMKDFDETDNGESFEFSIGTIEDLRAAIAKAEGRN